MKLRRYLLIITCLAVIGTLMSVPAGAVDWNPVFSDNFDSGKGAWWTDWGGLTEGVGGALMARGFMSWTVLNTNTYSASTPLRVTVDVARAQGSGAGFLLRAKGTSADNTELIPLIHPDLGGIYWHEKKGGDWGPQQDFVATPGLGLNITMEAILNGANATFTVSDGTLSYTTTHTIGRPELLTDGMVGIWHAWVDTPFDNFNVYVPEPSSILALACSLGGLAAFARRRRK